jgi:hypothetical protein
MAMYHTVEVEVDVSDILDELTDEDLASHGLMRTKPAGIPVGFKAPNAWHDVQQAMRRRDQSRLENLISTMAWEQAGVILPSGAPIIH